MLKNKKSGGGGDFLGVTLLEIMLVLAIAALIIVMSVRYYQSASASQRANACLSYLQAVVAAADSLSEGTQSYLNIRSAEIDAIVPRNNAVCNDTGNTGQTINDTTPDCIAIAITLPQQACFLMIPTLKSTGHWFHGSPSTKPRTPLDSDKCSIYSGTNHNTIVYCRSKE